MKLIPVFVLLAAIGSSMPSHAQTNNVVLVGTYVVTGTETDGKPNELLSNLVITMDKSGALDLNWDDGKYVGVGQMVGNVLAVAAVAEGKEVIMIMNVHSDGSLDGKWWRRTDAGNKGVETWKKK